MQNADNARIRLFGDNHRELPFHGDGVRVLLLGGDLPRGVEFGGRLNDFGSEPNAVGTAKMPSHALRVASICAEGEEARDLPGGPLGIAPRAQIAHASHSGHSVEQLEELIRTIADEVDRVDVIGLAWSAEEDHLLAHDGRASVARWADSEVGMAAATLAAAGHDGPDRLRFPASSEQIIAVGVCGPDRLPTAYCGTAPLQRKPELLVPCGDYLARVETGELGRMSGTSAAVAIAAGCAALLCERLRRAGVVPTPPMVRAALLAAASSSPHPAHRVLSGQALWPSTALCAMEQPHDPAVPLRMSLQSTGGTVSLAACIRVFDRPRCWVPRRPVLVLEASTAAAAPATWRADGPFWAVLDVPMPPGERLDIEVTLDGSCQSIAVVATGAHRIDAPRSVTSGRRHKPLTIAGISASHDGAACVMRDGRVEAAVQLERLTRRKRDGAGYLHSQQAVEYCLQSLGLDARDVDYFAFNAQPLLPGWVGLSQPVADAGFNLFDPLSERAIFVSHHLAHAFAAFAASPFESATVLVCDGSGGSVAGADDLLLRGPELERYLASALSQRPPLHVGSAYAFEPGSFKLVSRELAESFNIRCGSSSIGETYSAVSQYVFGDWHEAGKLMGLAPYGDPAEYGPSLLAAGPEGLLGFRADWKNRERRAVERLDPLGHRHLAARVQADFEEAVMQRVRQALERVGIPRLVFTGGLALNSCVNERIVREVGKGNSFFFPASHDAGIAIGAAAAASYLLTKDHRESPACDHDFLGHAYGPADYDLAIRAHASQLDVEPLDLSRLADDIAAGAITGWFEGGSEFGPRALGHRSILADARTRAMWTRVNAEVKYREDFRPLAPVVPVEEASRYFELDEPSPYMLRVVKIRQPYRAQLGAVCHVDGSARVQTVDGAVLPGLHHLLYLIRDRTGFPILVNTSLNRRGEPLIETPLQAIGMLLSTGLDALVMGDRILWPKRAAGGAIDLSHVITPSPDVRVVTSSSPQGPRSLIAASFRGEFELPNALAAVLHAADGRLCIQKLFDSYLPDHFDKEVALAWFTALYKQKLLMLHAG